MQCERRSSDVPEIEGHIPIIDLADALVSGQPRRLEAAAQIGRAAETSGFFYACFRWRRSPKTN